MLGSCLSSKVAIFNTLDHISLMTFSLCKHSHKTIYLSSHLLLCTDTSPGKVFYSCLFKKTKTKKQQLQANNSSIWQYTEKSTSLSLSLRPKQLIKEQVFVYPPIARGTSYQIYHVSLSGLHRMKGPVPKSLQL